MATILEFRPRGSAVSNVDDVADATTSAVNQGSAEAVSEGRRQRLRTDGPPCDILLFTGVRYSRDVPDMLYPGHADAIDGINAGA